MAIWSYTCYIPRNAVFFVFYFAPKTGSTQYEQIFCGGLPKRYEAFIVFLSLKQSPDKRSSNRDNQRRTN